MSGDRRVPAIAVTAAVVAWLLVLGSLVAMLLMDRQLVAAGRADLGSVSADDAVFLVAVAVATAVGTTLVLHQPRHPVGWLFLALGVSVMVSGPVDSYAEHGILARPGSRPGAAELAVLSATGWLIWFVLIALVLHLTPTGRPLSRRWGFAAAVTAVAGVLSMALTVFSPRALDDPPLNGRPNPWALDRFGAQIEASATAMGLVCAAGLVLSAASLVVRFRRSRGVERRQLLWLAIVVIPMPVLVIGAFAAAAAQNELGVSLFSGGFILLVPVAAGLSIARYRLYDVDRPRPRGNLHAPDPLVLAALYVGTVLFTVWSLRGLSGRSQIATAIATLITVSAAVPARRWLQDAVDRRFARRRFDALTVVRAALRGAAAERDLDGMLTEALADPGLRVAYLVGPEDRWVTAAGEPVVPAPRGPRSASC